MVLFQKEVEHKMMKLIESVPNFSEGRRIEVVEEIIKECEGFEEVWVLDWSMDYDHNRSVVTLVGTPDQLIEALFKMTKKASELIDLRKHKGEHPRMGATDVIPLVPVWNCKMEECVEASKKLGKRIGDELNIPVYLYEKSATTPLRENLAEIRKGEFEHFNEKISLDDWEPDFGPRKVHPTAGVTAVGAREYLVALNVNLKTDKIDVAKNIAKAVRNSSGGFKYVKAIGIELKEKGIVQVSMNLTNYKKSPIYRVFELIKLEAQRYGVQIAGTEIIGLVPMDSLVRVAEFYLQLENFDSSRILEKKILDILAEEIEKRNGEM